MRTYISATGYGIDVGESASENDELTFSADPEYWWFHASGYPGAHVVARVRTLDRETRRDAAILAVHHSKAPVDVKMTVVDTCRVANVSKPTNARGPSMSPRRVSQSSVCFEIRRLRRLG